jgi:hypothetical protein
MRPIEMEKAAPSIQNAAPSGERPTELNTPTNDRTIMVSGSIVILIRPAILSLL